MTINDIHTDHELTFGIELNPIFFSFTSCSLSVFASPLSYFFPNHCSEYAFLESRVYQKQFFYKVGVMSAYILPSLDPTSEVTPGILPYLIIIFTDKMGTQNIVAWQSNPRVEEKEHNDPQPL